MPSPEYRQPDNSSEPIRGRKQRGIWTVFPDVIGARERVHLRNAARAGALGIKRHR